MTLWRAGADRYPEEDDETCRRPTRQGLHAGGVTTLAAEGPSRGLPGSKQVPGPFRDPYLARCFCTYIPL